MGFKQVMPLLEPVAATYAMAAPSACVVDIGHTQTTVSCVDEGSVQNQSVIKKRFGGKDISEIMYRLLISSNHSLHYFPKDVFWPLSYPYHSMLLDKIKCGFNSL
jgi:actin-related protein